MVQRILVVHETANVEVTDAARLYRTATVWTAGVGITLRLPSNFGLTSAYVVGRFLPIAKIKEQLMPLEAKATLTPSSAFSAEGSLFADLGKHEIFAAIATHPPMTVRELAALQMPLQSQENREMP